MVPSLIFLCLILCISAEHCDVFIAGGSAASLATALTTARLLPKSVICLTEPTDWLGGQLTTQAVSAIDFGHANDPGQGNEHNNPLSFTILTKSIPGNPGGCWVSSKCYSPVNLTHGFIDPHVSAYKNLKVFYNTVIKATSKNSRTGEILEVTAIQRTPVQGTNGWEELLSRTLLDWYSPHDSSRFLKKILKFTGFKVIVEATEFADILLTADIDVSQGIEVPNQNSSTYFDVCGQANTIDFYMDYNQQRPVNPWTPPKGCQPCSDPAADGASCCRFGLEGHTWDSVWTYRRIKNNGKSWKESYPGDVSLQNWGSQDSIYYIWLPITEAKRQVQRGDWAGGVNITALEYSEDRAYGWYWYYLNSASATIRPYLTMNREEVGTKHGLAKMFYIRDTRRAQRGLGGFRLVSTHMDGFCDIEDKQLELDGAVDPSKFGCPFYDKVALGNYPLDTHIGACKEKIPSYMNNTNTKPYYIPFRALTTDQSPNLLLAGTSHSSLCAAELAPPPIAPCSRLTQLGKTMAQSFHANSGTRLHPEEWSSGVAAGAAAAFMIDNHYTSTAQVLQNIQKFQDLLKGVGQPLEWQLKSKN